MSNFIADSFTGSPLMVLALSANTSFVDFPRLCRLIAADRFLPHAFSIVGRRLVYSVGIVFLTTTAGLLRSRSAGSPTGSSRCSSTRCCATWRT